MTAAPTVTSITPNCGTPYTLKNVAIVGTNFIAGSGVLTEAWLRNAGGTPRKAISMVVSSSTNLTCKFAPLPLSPEGWWILAVINPDLQEGTLTYGFYVKSCPAPTPTPAPVPPTPATPPIGRLSNQADGAISFQLNSLTSSESVGSQYDHLMRLRETTNYDLRTRP